MKIELNWFQARRLLALVREAQQDNNIDGPLAAALERLLADMGAAADRAAFPHTPPEALARLREKGHHCRVCGDRYARCPHDGHEYCASYWRACPRCLERQHGIGAPKVMAAVRGCTPFEGWVRRLGLGFHPDTRGADYEPPLSAAEARCYDAAVEAEFASGRDPYARALAIWAEMGLPVG